MRRRQRVTHLQKTKRIRKNKKDFLRGSVQRVEPKVLYDNLTIPLPYILLFLALSATIIGYTSINFLFTKIHVNTPSLLSPFFAYLSAIKFPHIVLPSVVLPSITIPQIAFPAFHISMPTVHISFPTISINITPLFIWIEQSVRQIIPAITSFINPFPFWIEVFSTTEQAMIVSFLWILSFIQSMHFLETASNIVEQTGNGVHGLGMLFEEYLATVSVLLATTVQTIIQFCSYSLLLLADETVRHSQTLIESLLITWQFIETIVLYLVALQTTITELCINGIKIFFFAIIIILESIVNAIAFMSETIMLFIWHGLVAVFDWIMNIILAIKKSVDQTLLAIAAVIHLGDPIYNAIGESINELFTAIGTTITFLPKILK